MSFYCLPLRSPGKCCTGDVPYHRLAKPRCCVPHGMGKMLNAWTARFERHQLPYLRCAAPIASLMET